MATPNSQGTDQGASEVGPGRSKFYRGVVLTSIGSATAISLLFLETMVAVRLLAPGSYGIYVLITVVISFLDVIIDLGCTTAVTQLIASSDPKRQTKLANTALAFRLVVIAGISILFWFGKDSLRWLDSSEDLVRYAPYIPLMLAVYSLDQLLLRMVQGFQGYQQMAISQIIRSVLRLGLMVFFLVVLQLGVLALLYSWIISFGISGLYLYLVLPAARRLEWHSQSLGQLVRFGFPIQLNQLLILVSGRADVLLLGALAAPASVAMFAVAGRIPQGLLQLADSYTAVYFPTLSALLGGGQKEEAQRVLNNSLRLLSFAAAGTALTSVLFSREIVTLLFSEQYAASSWAFALLMVSFHMDVLVNLMGYTLTAAGYPGRSLAESGVRVVTNLATNIALIPVLGFVGAALARLLSYYISNPVDVWLLRRSDIQVAVGPYAKQTALLLLCIALFWWMQPVGFVYRFGIIGLFVLMNVALATISVSDLRLVLPRVATKRFAGLQKVG